jgi:hypothetical protein
VAVDELERLRIGPVVMCDAIECFHEPRMLDPGERRLVSTPDKLAALMQGPARTEGFGEISSV